MEKIRLNQDWSVMDSSVNPLVAMMVGDGSDVRRVNLPYDAMIHETRCENTANAQQSGYYPGKYYYYIKKLFVPEEWEGKKIVLEFEGVFMTAQVYINGDYTGNSLNGYAGFYINADGFLKFGEENEIKVCANNAMEANSRWYSGSGIYRNVNLYLSERVHIPVNGIRITTPDVEDGFALAEVCITIANEDVKQRTLHVVTEILDDEGTAVQENVAKVTTFPGKSTVSYARMGIRCPKLWNVDTPNLYTCKVRLMEEDRTADEASIRFGIRTVTIDAVRGLRINGSEIKLKGACVHHDNGILGAAAFEDAEERKCRLLKEAGFNCIRSAHNPISKAMLDACDRMGMLVMDELSDMWTRAKNINDYSWFFPDRWEEDVKNMVDKDFNHPSVILYCLGNEIQEAGTPRGAEMERQINHLVKSLDSTRFTTNSINGMLDVYDKIGVILSDLTGMDPKEIFGRMMTKENIVENEEGSNALNGMMSLLAGPVADGIAAHPLMSETVKEFADGLDVAGFNYMTSRHELEKNWNPNRVVLGSEAYPVEIPRIWDIVERNAHVIGDMTWTGIDYLGEAGIGIYHYDGSDNFTGHWPDRAAYVGDINLIGYRRPMSYYRKIVFGLRKEPYIAVERMDKAGMKHDTTPWIFKNDCIASWTWPGYEGTEAVVRVFSDAQEVELFVNQTSYGRMPAGRGQNYAAEFKVPYAPGELCAIHYRDGRETGRCVLKTAKEPVHMEICPDKTILRANGSDLSYCMVALKDEAGNDNLHAVREISVSVEGTASLEAVGSADPQAEQGYDQPVWKTYDGYLLAVIRAGMEAGETLVKFSSDDGGEKTVVISTVSA